MARLCIHAPGVHTGGGWIQLKDLLSNNLHNNCRLQLDDRIMDQVELMDVVDCYFIRSSFWGRLRAEIRLRKIISPNDIVLCFHGLPPIFPIRGKVYVFKQNRIHLGVPALGTFNFQVRLRLMAEKIICRLFKNNADVYLVQTQTMRRDLLNWGGKIDVYIAPFMKKKIIECEKSNTTIDFIYVADGENHKNHDKLIEAWDLLAEEGIFPSLVLTLPERNSNVIDMIKENIAEYAIDVRNYGELAHEEVICMYKSAKAMVYPSLSESFGLPLLEASNQSLPIVASEKDFVRDVCIPVETFDPESPVSIARAVKRFLGIEDQHIDIMTPDEFIRLLG